MMTRKLTIIAQDPSVKDSEGRILRTKVEVPYEELSAGPRGYRVSVIDYDSTQRILYAPLKLNGDTDPFENASDSELVNNPLFHAQNVYAVIMRLLSRYEYAFGRRVAWGNGFHQINVAPHAFNEPNAFYSDDAKGLFFGYFPIEDGKVVYTCLSHDIIAHEATHALLDGIRKTYTLPSYPDQAGFHEGFADVVAILSIFGLKDVVKRYLMGTDKSGNYIYKKALTSDSLKKNLLLAIGKQFGSEISDHTADALRKAVTMKSNKDALKDPLYQESHKRGEILSAAVLNSFIEVWAARLNAWLPEKDEKVLINRVVEDASDAAGHLLTMCIRALDYCPVVDITFDDYLASLLTADTELLSDDGKYKYRDILRGQFARWGIGVITNEKEEVYNNPKTELGAWKKIPAESKLNYECVHKNSLESDMNEAFRFLWENRKALNIFENAFTQVISIRSSVRVAPDGFVLKETVCEYRQTMELEAGQLGNINPKMKKPEGMTNSTQVRLNGGGVMIFDEYGHLKFHIASRIDDPERQSLRLKFLWVKNIKDKSGRFGFSDGAKRGKRFSDYLFKKEKTMKLLEGWDNDETE